MKQMMFKLFENSYKFRLEFSHRGKKIKFESPKAVDLYIDLVNWLSANGYSFSGELHENFIRKVFSKQEVDDILSQSPSYKRRGLGGMFFPIMGTNLYMYKGGNITKIYPNIIKYLQNFGVKNDTIKSFGFDKISSGINNFDEITSSVHTEEINYSFAENPFKQSICIIGKSGVGKSVTIRNILKNEGHNFDFIIPSALSGNLLTQYYPSKSEYRLSKLGKMIVDAANDTDNLYTMVIDEMHKSHVIEMINDELLQAISTDRNKYRFISLDSDTTDLFKESMPTEFFKAGNIVIPDNFGILFISSKEDVIINNDDFFNRVNIVFLTEEDRDMQTDEDLLSKVISPEEKRSLRKY